MTKKAKQVNQIKPNTAGVAIGMNANRVTNSSARLYMLGKNQGKAAVIWGSTNRKYISGDEQEYAKTARKVEIDTDVEVEEILFVKNILNDKTPNMWGVYYVIVKDLETGYYDVIEMPQFNAQNMDLGFEYRYDKDLMRAVKKGARFNKGTIFATSSRITESNEWCPGIETKVAAMSHVYTEEDAVFIHIGLGLSFVHLLKPPGEVQVAVFIDIAGVHQTVVDPAHLPVIHQRPRLTVAVKISAGGHHRVDAGVFLDRSALERCECLGIQAPDTEIAHDGSSDVKVNSSMLSEPVILP